MMIDTPRWSESLAARYELGPVTDVLLTHRDHAAHGRRYADRFGARLWIHEAEPRWWFCSSGGDAGGSPPCRGSGGPVIGHCVQDSQGIPAHPRRDWQTAGHHQ